MIHGTATIFNVLLMAVIPFHVKAQPASNIWPHLYKIW